MTDDPRDRRVIACNYAEGTKTCAKGARAYLVQTNPGSGHDRIVILARSRGGRWIEKWEDLRRLKAFRLTTIPPVHPLYRSTRIQDGDHRTVAILERAHGHRAHGDPWDAPLEWDRAGYRCQESAHFVDKRPPVIRITALADPAGPVLYYDVRDYYDLSNDDIAFATIIEAMMDAIRAGAF